MSLRLSRVGLDEEPVGEHVRGYLFGFGLRYRQALGINLVPIDVLEERVGLHFLGVRFPGSEPL